MNIALFDFDGTITDNNSFTPFIRYAVNKNRLLLGKLLLFPIILGYKLKIVPVSIDRESVSGFGFFGRSDIDLQTVGKKYAESFLPEHVRPEAIQRILWHKERGDQVVVVSASLDLYLKPWCAIYDLDLICSHLQFRNNICTGRYVDGDCTGKKKALRM